MSGLFSAMDISASGLAAERLRMETTANNIANANTTKTENGDPYRRKSVVFSSELQKEGRYTLASGFAGVEVVGIESDDTAFPMVHNPGHPHADEDGMVRMPNVKIPTEMVDMITASRSYEANLSSITMFQEMVEQSLRLLQGGS
ncbi:flagellar basal body rod protein FlgC [Mariniblastus fucicola]|uniref:Flagellar basal-body rod protein FlgC n=1 Tax=Mariniblastus fucicola TaxID=980251 RepID=A0A5B9PAS9_9BACT|nr:flagellar basal body rod protein FlgC [Mariniblastus fucicola]QEG23374.1 Flagellar basal-body rod protein FlgC [Mariniblastus fucicola]